MDLDGVIAFRAGECMQLLHLVRRRHQLHDFSEQRLRAIREIGRAAEEGKQLLSLHRFLHRVQRSASVDCIAAEVFLEKVVVSCGDSLDELLVVLVEQRLVLGGNFGFLVFAAARSLLEDVRFLVEQIQDAVKVDAFADRDFDRNDAWSKVALDGFEHCVERRVLLVHHRYDEEHGIFALDRFVVHARCSDFDSSGCADNYERAIGSVKPCRCFSLEVGISRRVEQVDLGVHPLGVRA